MKALAKFNKILDTNKVVNKVQFLTEDEKKLIQDMDYLKKQGYGDEFEAESAEDEWLIIYIYIIYHNLNDLINLQDCVCEAWRESMEQG